MVNALIMDSQHLLDKLPMPRLQIVAVILCIVLNAFDNFDVLAISFSALGIVAEWEISNA